ncbi:MAG: glycosyltransferase family 2 protein [Afipia sp.]|nr:glycosyltransferase family 2 protein [Afipia sp.]
MEVRAATDTVFKPQVAVLMAVRNGERFLSQQLDSLAGQESVGVDLWISDDGSSDASIDLIRRCADSGTLGRVELVDGPRRGFAENFRSLIVRAEIKADFYAFCDQDDVWDEDKLAHAIEWLKTQPAGKPALYCSRTRIIAPSGKVIGQSPRFPRPPGFRNAIVQSIAGGNTMVMNRAARDLVAEASRRTDFVSHDWWCYMIVSGAGGNVHYCSQPRVGYRQHDGNLVGENNTWRARMSRLGFLMRGRFKEWNDRNISGLAACSDLLSDDARLTLDLFMRSREGRLSARLLSLWRSGVYRQTILGGWGLYLACIVRRL